MVQSIDQRLLGKLTDHTRRLGVKRVLQGMGYERSGELPLVASRLEPLFDEKLSYIDIGSGDSVFPTYVLKNSKWDVTCVDKFSWVQKQHTYARRIMKQTEYAGRLHVLQKDFLSTELPSGTFDIVTNISVVEHFENGADSTAMQKSALLLKRGGLYILTTPVNEGHYREFSMRRDVYGEPFRSHPVFFQRHYDVASFEARVVKPTHLKVFEFSPSLTVEEVKGGVNHIKHLWGEEG